MSIQCPKCGYYFDEDKILDHLTYYHKLGIANARKVMEGLDVPNRSET